MKAIGPLVGYVMRETKGRADGGEVTRLIRERLCGCSARWLGAGVGLAGPIEHLRGGSRMSRLIRMDQTGHTTVAEWTAEIRQR